VFGAIKRYLRSFTGFSRDAKLFLLTTVVLGSAQSVFWIDYNLYLEKVGIDAATIGWLLAAQQLAGVLFAFPSSALANRFGRKQVMVLGVAMTTLALGAVLQGTLAAVFVGTVMIGAGSMAVSVVQVPFIAEHTKPEQRNAYFSLWQAIGFLTAVIAAILGGGLAPLLADTLNMHGSAAPYQILLSGTAVLFLLSLLTVTLLSGERAADPEAKGAAAAGGHKTGEGRLARFGIVVHDRRLMAMLLLPGFITALGAGQLIPFLNVFLEHKFELDLAAINVIFGVSNLGTAVAILIQPAVARRFGRIGSIVLVQGTSIPFLLVLGFSPALWTVIVALAVRNSLMNAGGPIFDAFAMESVSVAERTTLTAGMTLLWSLGWTIAPLYHSQLQAHLGFEAGFTVNFVTIILLYTLSTSLLWTWFRGRDSARDVTAPVPAQLPEPGAPLSDQA
jgi:MFS family permease